jgi:thioredoxin reductase/ferredoxin
MLPPTGKSVAVVGSGPAGLTAAYYLAKQGHKVTVFEALPKPGGAMLVGIPEYRLPRNVLDGEINEIKNAGVEIRLNTRVTSVDSLLKPGGTYDAVFLGVGAHLGMKLGCEGENLPGVIEAVDFLRRGNLGERVNVGKRVGVVGGGNVAIDAARLALRFGAEQVTMFYRRTQAEMPAAEEEVEAAMKEGVVMNFLTAPSKIAREGDTLRFECRRMKLGEPDASGRPRPVEIPGSEFVTELDTLIGAIGQRPDVPKDFKVEVGRGNTVTVNADMQSSRAGVFSAGDCVTGPASVIGAIGGARKAASAIDRYLGGDGEINETLVPPEEAENWLKEDMVPEAYAPTHHLPPEISKTGFDEVEQAWDWKTAMAEGNRCLKCYVITPPNDLVLQEANCQFCGACVDACPTGALVERTVYLSGGCDRWVTTICPYCGVGCQLKVEIKDGAITRVIPDHDGPANHGQACVKGKFGLDFIFHPDRLKKPLIKKDGQFVEATWDEALDTVARQLEKYKPDEVAVISSAKNTNEDNYVAQKFTRAVLGTNTIDHCARL